jgi:hypothetical protein
MKLLERFRVLSWFKEMTESEITPCSLHLGSSKVTTRPELSGPSKPRLMEELQVMPAQLQQLEEDKFQSSIAEAKPFMKPSNAFKSSELQVRF